MKHGHDGSQALLVQADALLDYLFYSGRLFSSLLSRSILCHEAMNGIHGQVAFMFQVAIGDLFLFWMVFKPALAMSQQFFDLFIAYEVMFIVIQDGDQYVEMRQ